MQLKKNMLPWLTQRGNGVDYSIEDPGPHGPGYRLADSPVSCHQLKADAGTTDYTDVQPPLPQGLGYVQV